MYEWVCEDWPPAPIVLTHHHAFHHHAPHHARADIGYSFPQWHGVAVASKNCGADCHYVWIDDGGLGGGGDFGGGYAISNATDVGYGGFGGGGFGGLGGGGTVDSGQAFPWGSQLVAQTTETVINQTITTIIQPCCCTPVTAIPEPATWAMIIMGALALYAMKRRTIR